MGYDLIASYLNDEPRLFQRRTWPSERHGFITTLHDAETYFASGTIPNARYLECKDGINGALEKAFHVIREKHVFGKRHELPEIVLDFDDAIHGNIFLSKLAIAHRRAATFELAHPYLIEAMAFLNVASPLATMFTALRTMAVKRQPKPVEERTPGYHPPVVTTEYQKVVVALLERVTLAAYAELKQSVASQFSDYLVAFLKAQSKDNPVSPYRFFTKGRFPNLTAADAVEKLTIHQPRKGVRPEAYDRRDDHAAILETLATEIADEYRTFFVHKNFQKIASIIEAKGGYQSAHVLGHRVSLTGMDGRFRFTFKDGSQFSVLNQAVTAYSSTGKQFVRHPLTFHGVKLSDGQMMSRPSQARMNEVFARA